MSYAFMRFPGDRELAFTLSYDDAMPADKRLVEILNRYGLKATFNLNGGKVNQVGRMLIEELKPLYISNGHEVAVHGACHYSLGEIPDCLVLQEILDNRRALENTFGVIVKGLAYPNRSFNDRVVNLIQACGIDYARAATDTEKFDIPTDWLRLMPTCHHKNPRLMELAKTFLKGGNKRHYFYHQPLLFYVWGHSYEFDNDNNWEMMEEFCKFIGGREDVWYATNGEIYDYIKAYDSLIYSTDGLMVKNPTATDVFIHYFGKPFIIRAGETIGLER